MVRLVLASRSPSRLAILRSAGFDPEVIVSGVDEDTDGSATSSVVVDLACRKARAVAKTCGEALVIGCDSLLDVNGHSFGKPVSIERARDHWKVLRGITATLMTGHCVINTMNGIEASDVVATNVTFGYPSEDELEAYLSTGESLTTAGGFTLEGYGAPFVERVEGDALNVMGISPTRIAQLLPLVGCTLTDCWPRAPKS